MATPAQIAANRVNALKSTGPRSDEGKAASRFNALKHGMDAESLVIPGEDPEALAALSADYYARIQPDGPIERHYVDTMVNCDWLRRRLRRCEAQLYRALTEGDESESPLGSAWQRDAAGPNALQKIFRQLSALDRNYAGALAELRRLQAHSQPEEIELDAGLPLSIMQAAGMSAYPAASASPSRQFGFVPPQPPGATAVIRRALHGSAGGRLRVAAR